ncbi:MAG TPA: NFACT RNA binding domain-containing protein [Ignavibacteriaceae bacterium]|nr:NFACT RNA binding domain-containing protein [Ignavibacteriaceae bacterium]
MRMLQNYFFLNRFLIEAKEFLPDSRIDEIFSQEKSKLVIVVSKNGEEYCLELCVIPGNSYLNIRKNYSRAKKNTVNFFDAALGEKIDSLQIANNDRIIKLKCTHSEIYFTIRGKFTNVFYFDADNQARAFKTVDDHTLENIKKEFGEKVFLSVWNQIDHLIEIKENYLDEIRKKYPILGSEIIKEVKSRLRTDGSNDFSALLNDVLNEIRISNPCVFIDEKEQEIHLGFENFKSFPFTEKKIFESLIDAVNFLLSKKYYLNDKYSKEKLVRNHLEREIKKVSSKIQNLQGLIERGTKEAEYSKFGQLLLANLGLIKSRMSSIIVEDIISGGEKIKIDLNPSLSPQKNVDYYFDKSRSEKISFNKNLQLFEAAKKDYERLKKLENSLNEIDSTKKLDELMKTLKIKQPQESEAKEDLGSKFKQYLIEGKYKVYVGKDSKSNDLLTTRFAKQNDYWFHARGSSGSHVVLRVENTKEPIPKNVLKKAASIAAYHSKAKTAGVVPVAYTFKKYVVKKKGDPSGTVRLLREAVLLVKPEIPAVCEYISAQD